MKRFILVAAGAAALVWSARAEAETSGSVGDGTDDVKWSVVANVLMIHGSGAMTNFEWTTDRPWHEYADSITSVIVWGDVTNVGDSAFAGFGQLGAVSISANVTRIGCNAFYDCPQLTKVDLSELTKLTAIGENCFYHNVSLEEVKLPPSLVDIGDSAFWGCASLKTPEFALGGGSLKRIGALAFWRCEAMDEFIVGAAVTNVGTKAFGWCTGLERVVFLGTDTSVASNSFLGVGWDLSAPLLSGEMLDLLLKGLDIGSDMIVANLATEDIPDDYACYGPAYAENLPELSLPEGWKGVKYVEPYEPWCRGFFVCKSFDIPWGTVKYPWHIGATEADQLYAYIQDGVLYIVGSGDIYPYESESDVPWAGKIDEIEEVSFEYELVYLAKLAAFGGFDPEVGVAGLGGLSLRDLRGENTGAITPAGAERIEIADGKVHLGVSVATNANLAADAETWQRANIEDVRKEPDGSVTLTIPATAENGFMILKSKSAGQGDAAGD